LGKWSGPRVAGARSCFLMGREGKVTLDAKKTKVYSLPIRERERTDVIGALCGRRAASGTGTDRNRYPVNCRGTALPGEKMQLLSQSGLGAATNKRK